MGTGSGGNKGQRTNNMRIECEQALKLCPKNKVNKLYIAQQNIFEKMPNADFLNQLLRFSSIFGGIPLPLFHPYWGAAKEEIQTSDFW